MSHPASFWNHSTVREVERASIRAFVQSCSEHLTGRVLDYGCGQQPYRDIVEAAGGDYVPYDRAGFPGNVSGEDVGDDNVRYLAYGAVLCTQVVQYWPDVAGELGWLRSRINDGGALVLTYPCSWDWIERTTDRWRFTPLGMRQLLDEAGFTVERHEERAAVELAGFRFPLGYGAVARA